MSLKGIKVKFDGHNGTYLQHGAEVEILGGEARVKVSDSVTATIDVRLLSLTKGSEDNANSSKI